MPNTTKGIYTLHKYLCFIYFLNAPDPFRTFNSPLYLCYKHFQECVGMTLIHMCFYRNFAILLKYPRNILNIPESKFYRILWKELKYP